MEWVNTDTGEESVPTGPVIWTHIRGHVVSGKTVTMVARLCNCGNRSPQVPKLKLNHIQMFRDSLQIQTRTDEFTRIIDTIL